MFDELDLIMDGAKVNSSEDWVALFGDDNDDGVAMLVLLARTNVIIE